ncbi:MAG: alpha/beta fold hydrolase [Actinomycetota bacterium]
MRFIARQIKRLVLGVLLLIGGLAAAVVATDFGLRLRYHAIKQTGVPEGPPPGFDPPGERTLSGVMEGLERVPFEPSYLGIIPAVLNNNLLLALNAMRATSARMYQYPADFDNTVIESFDGTPITVVVGIHGDRPRPAIVMSHGFMGSKNDHYIIDSAITAYGWGFNVLGIDLRNFGRSQALTHTPTSAGWKEGEDLLAAAKYLGEMPEVTSVGIMGFSMGAGSTMRAAYMAKEYPYLTGGAIAWNGYSDAGRMIEYIGTKPPLNHPFYPVYLGFRLMHFMRRRDMLGYVTDPEQRKHLEGGFHDADFCSYVEEIAAPHYGVTVEEYYRNASPREYLADVEVPLLVVHAADDPICPASEMDDLQEVVRDNPNVNIWMLPTGNHCLFRYMDRNWYETVMRDYFTYWATWD